MTQFYISKLCHVHVVENVRQSDSYAASVPEVLVHTVFIFRAADWSSCTVNQLSDFSNDGCTYWNCAAVPRLWMCATRTCTHALPVSWEVWCIRSSSLNSPGASYSSALPRGKTTVKLPGFRICIFRLFILRLQRHSFLLQSWLITSGVFSRSSWIISPGNIENKSKREGRAMVIYATSMLDSWWLALQMFFQPQH